MIKISQIDLIVLLSAIALLLCIFGWMLFRSRYGKKTPNSLDLLEKIHFPINDMSSILIHELTQPLASALISSQAAIKGIEDANLGCPKVVDSLTRAIAALRKTNDILSRFRSFIQQGTFKPQIESLNWNELIEEVLEVIKPLAQERSVAIIYEKSMNAINLMGDRIQLSQVLLNLLVNAIDAASLTSSDKAQVTIKAGSTKNGLEIVITDTGPGFHPEILKSVGKPFTTNKKEGLGLGIPIAKQIISKHQGELSWTNLVNGGACLRIFLPHLL